MIPRLLQSTLAKAESEAGVIPGDSTLRAGNSTIGWFGEVPASEFVNTTELRALIGLDIGTPTVGTSVEPWLKFSYNDKILFIAKRPLLHSVSWNQLNALGLVSGSNEIEVEGVRYRVRLMLGSTPTMATSEWNNLMYRVCNTQTATPRFAAYTIAQLGVNWANNIGSWTICQEMNGKMIIRGGGNIVASGNNDSPITSGNFYGWRPVLEVIQ